MGFKTKAFQKALEKTTGSSNTYDQGQYWDAPVDSGNSQFKTKAFRDATFKADPNYYQHKDIADVTGRLHDSNISIPSPDVAETKDNRPWYQKYIFDPLSSLQYGSANAVKSMVDDNPETNFFNGFGKGVASGFNNDTENKTSWAETFKLLDKKGRENPSVGGLFPYIVDGMNWVMEKQLKDNSLFANKINPVLEEKGLTWDDLEKSGAMRNATLDALGFAGDVVLDPLNLVGGVGAGAKLLAKGSEALKIADKLAEGGKAVDKAQDVLKVLGKGEDVKDAEYLVNKTSKLIGGMPDYKGITVGVGEHTVPIVPAKYIGKAGDALSKAGINPFKAVDVAGDAVKGTKVGKWFTNAFGSVDADTIDFARKNPDKALAVVASNQNTKSLWYKWFGLKQHELYNEAQDLGKQIGGRDNQEKISNAIENGNIEKVYYDNVEKTVQNPEYLIQMRNRRRFYDQRLQELQTERETALTAMEGADPATRAKHLADLTKLETLVSQYDSIPKFQSIEYMEQLQNAGVNVDKIFAKDDEMAKLMFTDTMFAGQNSIRDLTESLIAGREMGIISDLSNEELTNIAIRMKKASEQTTESLREIFGDLVDDYVGSGSSTINEIADMGGALAMPSKLDNPDVQMYTDRINELKKQLDVMNMNNLDEYNGLPKAHYEEQLRQVQGMLDEIKADNWKDWRGKYEGDKTGNSKMEDYLNKTSKPEETVEPPRTKRMATPEELADTKSRIGNNLIQEEKIGWGRTANNSYEISSKGDSRFSALNAKLKDGRTIEEAYQLDVKGYRSNGNDWRLGKRKAPLNKMSKEQSYIEYKKLWEQWANENPELLKELYEKTKGKTLTDMFASTNINQARALSEIINEKFYDGVKTIKPIDSNIVSKEIKAEKLTKEKLAMNNPKVRTVFGTTVPIDDDIKKLQQEVAKLKTNPLQKMVDYVAPTKIDLSNMTAEQKFAYKVKLEKQWRMATGKGIEKATESQIKSLKNMAYASQTVLDDAYIESLDKFQASELYKHLQSKIENYKNQRIEKFELEDELQRGNVADLKKGTAPSMTPSNTYMNEIATDPDDLKKLERTMERLEKHGVDPDLYDSDIIDRFEKGELTRRQVAEFMSDTSKLMDDNVTSEGTSGLVSVKSGISEQKIKNLETALKNLERTKPDVVSTIRERLAKTPIKDEVMYKAELKNVFSELSSKAQDDIIREIPEFAEFKAKGNTLQMPEDEAHFHKFQTQFGEFKIDTKADPEFVKKIQNAIKELPEELQNVIKSHSIEVIRGKKINGKFEAGATTFNKGSNITFWDTDNMRKLNNNELKNMLQHEIGHVVDYNSTSRRAYVTKSLKSELGKLGDAEIDELATTIKSSSSHMVKDMDVEKIKELLKSGNISPYPTKIADSLQADREHFAELTAIMFDGNTSKQIREMLPETTEKFYRMIKNTPVEDITRDIPKTVSARDEIIRKLEATKQVIDTFEGADLKHLDKNIEKLDRILSSNEDFEKFFDKEFGAHMPPKTKTVTERVRKTEEVDWTESLPSELREPAKKIKEQFDSWAEEEGLEKIENYVPHVLSYELRKNKKALSKVPEMKMPDNLNELHRKYEGTISEINKTMKEKYDIDNFFDTMIVRSYLERGIKHNKFMFEKEYLDQTLNLFGQRVDKQAFASLSKEQKKALWEDIQTKKKSGEYVFVELGDKYNPVTKKTIDNSEITEGYARRNATREASRLNDSDNPLVDELNQYQINNPFIQIDPRKITEEELFARGENPIYILPKVMHDKYLKTVQKQYGKQKNIIIDMIDRFTHLWKAKATTSASFHATNMMGNTFNSYLSIGSRILDPELNRVAIQIGRGKGSFMGRTGEEWRKILSEYGIGDFTQFSDSVKDFRKGLTDDIMEQNPLRKTIKRINPFSTENVVYKGNQKIGGAIENQAKIVNFIAHVQDGKSLQEASDLVNKFLFDYTDVTDFEQNWMKRIVPFYTWMKKNIPLQFEQIIDNPAKYGRIQRGINSFSQPETDEEKRYKPDYLGDAIHTGHGEYTNVNLPYKDLGKLNPKDMFSSVNPLLKMIAEVGTNTNTYFGSPIKNNEGELVKPTPYQIPFAKDTPNGKMIDPTVKYILDLLNPDFKRFSDIAQSASDGDFEATMGKASGIKKYNVDYEKERKNAMYKYIQKLKELETNSRKQGYIKK